MTHARTDPPATFALDDIQGNVLRPYKLEFASFGFVRFPSAAAGKAWIARLLPSVTRATTWEPGDKPTTLNLAFTAAGLKALGVGPQELDSFPEEFVAGMAQRCDILGDSGDSAPAAWEHPQWCSGDVHAMVAVHATSQAGVATRWEQVGGKRGSPGECVEILFRDEAHRLPDNQEHFGFVDGFGQPLLAVAGTGRQFYGQGTPDGHGGWKPVAIGEFLLGHPDEEQRIPPPIRPRALSDNATFLVYRKLEQDVPAFRAWLGTQAAQLGWERERVAANVLGRWPDGSPLELRPDAPDKELGADRCTNNNFTYRSDPEGFLCPVGAHIRRANPRDSLGFHANAVQHLLGFRPEELVSRHRMIRRGIPYGEPLAPGAAADGAERGLLFIAAVSSPARQFEFVQSQWLNDGNLFHLGGDRDVLAGRHGSGGKMTVQGAPPKFLTQIPSLIRLRGGDYFLQPGIGGLTWLSQ